MLKVTTNEEKRSLQSENELHFHRTALKILYSSSYTISVLVLVLAAEKTHDFRPSVD